MNVTVTFKSGGIIKLTNAFNAGNGIVGNLASGESKWFDCEGIESIHTN